MNIFTAVPSAIMRTLDGILSKRAQKIDPTALVYKEDDGTYTLERRIVVSLGNSFGRAQSALETLKVSHDVKPTPSTSE